MQPQSFPAWTLYHYILEADTLSLEKNKVKTSLHFYILCPVYL